LQDRPGILPFVDSSVCAVPFIEVLEGDEQSGGVGLEAAIEAGCSPSPPRACRDAGRDRRIASAFAAIASVRERLAACGVMTAVAIIA
jgi:hypothetical protein